jgi:hypothetical protein
MRCRFFKTCGDSESVTCAEEGGLYYEAPNPFCVSGRMAGCYRVREEELRIKTPMIHYIHFKLFTQKSEKSGGIEA